MTDSPTSTNTDASAAPSGAKRSRRGSHPVVAFVAAVVVVLGIAEGAVRVAERRLPEPLRYFSGQAQNVVNDMEVLAANGITSRVTFVGTSMVRRDVDAARVEAELGWPDTSVHNIALPGAQTPVVERWLTEEVVPRLHPKVVVWGVSTLDFNSGRPDHPIDQYNAARASQRGLFGSLDRTMEHSALSKHRDALRDPFQLKAAASGTGTKYTLHKSMRARASWRLRYDPKTPEQLVRMKQNHRTTIVDNQLKNFRIDTEEFGAFERTIEELQSQGIKVVIVVMPVPSDYLPLHPKGEAQFAAWKARTVNRARELGATVIDDLDRSMPDTAFRDYEHLWPEPAREQFTPALTRRLQDAPWWDEVFAS